MLTWNYRVFREEDGDYIIRSVTYDENGAMVGCTENEVAPVGRSLKELAEDIKSFKEALALPVLTLADMPCAPKKTRKRDRSKNLSIEQVRATLGLEAPHNGTSIEKGATRGTRAKPARKAAARPRSTR